MLWTSFSFEMISDLNVFIDLKKFPANFEFILNTIEPTDTQTAAVV